MWCPYWGYPFYRVWLSGLSPDCSEDSLLSLLEERGCPVQAVYKCHQDPRQAIAFFWSLEDAVEAVSMSIFSGDSELQMDLCWWERDAWDHLQDSLLAIISAPITFTSPCLGGPLPAGKLGPRTEVAQQELRDLEDLVMQLTGLLTTARQPLEATSKMIPTQELEVTVCQLQLAVGCVEKTFKVLAEVTTCPLTLTLFKQPLLAPDGNSYEKSSIVRWLRKSGLSPVTRDPMREDQLLRNRALERLSEVLPPAGPEELDGEEDTATDLDHSDEELQDHIPGMELIAAIEEHNEEAALELALGPLDLDVLNGRHGDQRQTVLHLALLHGQPRVAMALLDRRDFREYGVYMGSPAASICSLHLATALGHHDVCEALFRRGGVVFAGMPVFAACRVALGDGEELRFVAGNTSADIARQFGHLHILPMIEAAADEMGDFETEMQRRIAQFEVARGPLPS